ncbi:SDR family NAD(P)-dependent oxidoreductase [Hyphobacterium sp. HN65]|uniref:SDR family NAD(P)-dependent oxidoreductase n=1 Tax=Hyphobacterium lacteum TaxID=3116575 RepID=A0ABU7LTT5_9PROT|nr:SDR family NAD(P)-dependent oxidoreductase [Hyphobacterium sp. HN65]MEE2527316.1 SDR family NAD(P)-dependent oxidoreductase [Hyphobacterium sp. HN65]
MTITQPAAVVTGASTGIGEATTRVLIQEGWHVFAGVRKPSDAERLKQAFGDAVTPLTMEVTDTASMQAAGDEVRKALGGQTLRGLVCNAGVAVSGPLLHIPIEEVERQLDINVLGVLRTVQAFGPLLGADQSLSGDKGRVVMMSSVAGVMGMPFVGPYAASKHAVEGLSKSLRKELNLYGIGVHVIGPGAVATPIWDKADDNSEIENYRGSDYETSMQRVLNWMLDRGPKGLPPEQIGRRVHHCLTAANPKNRYAEVPERFQNWTMPRLLPEKVVDKQIAKRLALRPEDLKRS